MIGQLNGPLQKKKKENNLNMYSQLINMHLSKCIVIKEDIYTFTLTRQAFTHSCVNINLKKNIYMATIQMSVINDLH